MKYNPKNELYDMKKETKQENDQLLEFLGIFRKYFLSLFIQKV